jgi:hypothetical protein
MKKELDSLKSSPQHIFMNSLHETEWVGLKSRVAAIEAELFDDEDEEDESEESNDNSDQISHKSTFSKAKSR